MDVKNITDKILQDVEIESKKITQKANLTAKEKTQETNEIIERETRELKDKLLSYKKQAEATYKSKLNLEKKKKDIAFNRALLASFQEYLYKYFLGLSKTKKLKHLTSILKKEAKEKDTISVFYSGVNASDIENLKIVKNLNLKVKMGSDEGVIISNSSYDANFLVYDLVSNFVTNNENAILNQILENKN